MTCKHNQYVIWQLEILSWLLCNDAYFQSNALQVQSNKQEQPWNQLQLGIYWDT